MTCPKRDRSALSAEDECDAIRAQLSRVQAENARLVAENDALQKRVALAETQPEPPKAWVVYDAEDDSYLGQPRGAWVADPRRARRFDSETEATLTALRELCGDVKAIPAAKAFACGAAAPVWFIRRLSDGVYYAPQTDGGWSSNPADAEEFSSARKAFAQRRRLGWKRSFAFVSRGAGRPA